MIHFPTLAERGRQRESRGLPETPNYQGIWLSLYPHPTAPHVLQAPPSTFRGPPHRSEATQTPSASAQPSSGGEHGPLKRTTPFVTHCPGRHQAPPPRYYWIMCLPLARVCLWRRRDHSPARPARFLKGTAPFLLHRWLTWTPQHAGWGGVGKQRGSHPRELTPQTSISTMQDIPLSLLP